MHSFVITTCHFRSSVHQGKWVLICESDVAITSLDEAMHSDKVLADEERSSLSSAYDLLGYYGHSRRLLTYQQTSSHTTKQHVEGVAGNSMEYGV